MTTIADELRITARDALFLLRVIQYYKMRGWTSVSPECPYLNQFTIAEAAAFCGCHRSTASRHLHSIVRNSDFIFYVSAYRCYTAPDTRKRKFVLNYTAPVLIEHIRVRASMVKSKKYFQKIARQQRMIDAWADECGR